MYESAANDYVPSTATLSTSLLHRSKSYETKLNINPNDPIYGGYDSIFSSLNQQKRIEPIQDNEQAKIIITSFAPKPNDNKTRYANTPSSQVRPTSHIISANSSLTTLTNQNNSFSKIDQSNDQNTNRNLSLIWIDGKSSVPIISFCAKVLRKTYWECKKIGEQYRLTFKFLHGERKLVKAILEGHGFREVHPNSSEFNIIWSGSNLKSYTFRSLQENQKVNHFPRSCELTRKDRLYKNIQRMQKEKGQKAFNIVPTTFVLPYEIDEFYATFYREKGIWIVKPVCLSRGRGIYLISHPDQIPLDDNLVVSKYLSNPLLIEGFKFDLRLYVAVTSFDPLVFYLYEEGLTRFATIKYDQNVRNIRNTCMHLTNYSVNKKNEKYVKCNDPDVENYGNKWSMSALLRYLNAQGKDTFSLMMNIEEVLIKTLLSVESPMASAARMFMPFRGNCFELFGFDILVDDTLKPWVLEVNLSPSLDCDALLDIRIKSSMISDLFTLTGIYCQNPNIYSNRSRQRDVLKNKNEFKSRPHSASIGGSNNSKSSSDHKKTLDPLYDGLSNTEQTILKNVIDENQRSNGWVRLFPTSDSWEFYSQYLEVRSTNYNMMLHKKLFPRRWQGGGNPKKATQPRTKVLESIHDLYKTNNYSSSETTGASLYEALDRYKKYERKLVDNVKPNEETLKKLSNSPYMPVMPVQSLKTNFNLFPNGDKYAKKEVNLSSDMLANQEDSSNSSDNENNYRVKSSKENSINKNVQSLNRNRTGSAYNYKANYKYDDKINSKKSLKKMKKINADDDDLEEEDLNEEENESNISKESSSKNLEIKYDLGTVLKHLEQGYYLSRIQVRSAFSLYLFKIQVRLVAESESKDESNLHQMDLVLRFIKKAAPNLSQEFKVFVPSKKLPICEQKRMLAKQLHDFLHIYRKDTEQIRIDTKSLLEIERKRNKKKLIEERGFQTLLNKCSEVDLEEIMSAYMKNSNDSSVFLGNNKHSSYKEQSIGSTSSDNIEKLNFNLNRTEDSSSTSIQSNKIETNTLNNNDDFKKEEQIQIKKFTKSSKKLNLGDDDLSQVSCDSHSMFSKSSDSESEVKQRSRSNSSSLSILNKQTILTYNTENKHSVKSKQKIKTNLNLNSNVKNKNKLKNNDYQTIMANIYTKSTKNYQANTNQNTNKTKSAKTKSKTNTNLRLIRPSTSISSNLNKLAPLSVNSQLSTNSNQNELFSPLSNTSKDSIPSSSNGLNTLKLKHEPNIFIQKNQPASINLSCSNSNRSPLITSNSNMNLNEQDELLSGLKNLNLKQQERIYSAANSTLRIKSSLAFEEANSVLKSNQTDDNIEIKRLKEITSLNRNSPNTNGLGKLDSDLSDKNLTLIQKLEKQKEKTNKLLAKSKAKHSEMISSIISPSNTTSNTKKLLSIN